MADNVLDLAQTRLDWLDRRQTLLAQNIANANTPGWQPRDLAPFAQVLAGVQDAATPVRTNPMHLAGTRDDAAPALLRPSEIAADGNAVRLDTELTKVADTDVNQEMVGDIYKKYLGFYRTALGR